MKNAKLLLVALTLTAAGSAVAGAGPAWAWDSGLVTSGKVQLKSSSGATIYDVQQNPSGAVAKANQSALTQPPTVIVQATSALPFTYKEDCWFIRTSKSDGGVIDFIVAGTKDANGYFRGLMAKLDFSGNSTGGGGAQALMSAMLGVSTGGGAGHKTTFCQNAMNTCAELVSPDEVLLINRPFRPWGYQQCYGNNPVGNWIIL